VNLCICVCVCACVRVCLCVCVCVCVCVKERERVHPVVREAVGCILVANNGVQQFHRREEKEKACCEAKRATSSIKTTNTNVKGIISFVES